MNNNIDLKIKSQNYLFKKNIGIWLYKYTYYDTCLITTISEYKIKYILGTFSLSWNGFYIFKPLLEPFWQLTT